jgi:hypothetical protein
MLLKKQEWFKGHFFYSNKQQVVTMGSKSDTKDEQKISSMFVTFLIYTIS